MANRIIDLPAIFAEDANVVIPTFPTPGSGYRKEPLEAIDIQNGWQFSTKVDSSIHNQAMFVITSLLQQIAQQGFLTWCATTAYAKGAITFGSDGNQYKAVIASTNVDPTTAPVSTWKPHTSDYAGKFVEFGFNAPPPGYLLCDGSAVSRALYPDLFNAIGITWGNGDGGTTFNLPDARGRFLRSFDSGAGVDAGRVFGTSQLDAFQNITGSWNGDDQSSPSNTTIYNGGANGSQGYSQAGSDMILMFDTSHDPALRTSTETRPVNITALICIAI